MGLGLFLSTCKKYPENTLWFKNPEKLFPQNSHITSYVVNGIDSLDLLNSYYGSNLGLNKNIREAKFVNFESVGGTLELDFGAGLATPLFMTFLKKDKYVQMSIFVDTNYYKKHLFIDKYTEWKIIRLAKKGPFKISTTLSNGNKYEIQIE